MTDSALKDPRPSDYLTPKLVTVLREGYGLAAFRADAIAGLTVAIVALPLSMAIAIASGAAPEKGLYTAIFGGFIISAFGGSRYQIGGPAGAFIVLVAAIVAEHGYDGLLLATFMAGFLMAAAGLLKLGTYIKYVPHPVTVGFTAGIAVIIFASQLRELLGLASAVKEPGELLPKLAWIWQSLASVNPQTAMLSGAAIAGIVVLGKLRPRWPAFLIVVALGALASWALKLDVQTIGTRFGGIPGALPQPAIPAGGISRILELLPSALALALLGGIESLLSAVVADSMSGRRHRSNMELIAQGLANIVAPVFGGITATGTIARTATNVRAGAHGPVAGMLHSVFLLAFMLAAAPLASYIPLAVLGAILAVVAWKMAERAEFWLLLTSSPGEATVLLATFGLTIFRDLTEGILVGVTLGSLLFMHRMAQSVRVKTHRGEAEAEDETPVGGDIIVHRIAGAFFFGAAGTISSVLERIHETPRAYVLDLTDVPFADSSAAHMLHAFIRKAAKHGAVVHLAGASAVVKQDLRRFGIREPEVRFSPSAAASIRDVRKENGTAAPARTGDP